MAGHARVDSYRERRGQRIAAARMAMRDVEREIAMLVAERLDELLAGLHEEAEAVTHRCNEALAEIGASYQAREQVAARIDAMAGTIRRPRFGDITLTKMEPAVREANRILGDDGEAVPALRQDSRLPRGGSVPAEPESPFATVKP